MPKSASPSYSHTEPDFARNLRFLCSYYRSVSEVCRRVGLNRQQFNKYVVGSARPSGRNMRRICDFFGVDEYEILSPHAELRRIIEIKGVRNAEDSESAVLQRIKDTMSSSGKELQAYLGCYHFYFYSFSYPGKLLKALLHMTERNGLVTYRRIERLIDRETPYSTGSVFKYEGVAIYLRERIFMIDHEALMGNEISQTILYPSYKSNVDLLSGLTLGTAGKTSREPICSRVVLQFLGDSIDLRPAMTSCGLYNPDSQEIDPAIRQSITNDIPDNVYALRAIPQ